MLQEDQNPRIAPARWKSLVLAGGRKSWLNQGMDTFRGAAHRMQEIALPLVLGLLVLSGCASSYVIKLTNGAEITTPSKPQLDGGAYRFKDAKGEQHLIPAGRVREIAPASIAKEEQKAKRAPSTPAPHKRKWYLLWLA
jgi:hypothetical protein